MHLRYPMMSAWLGLLILAACIPESDHPLSDPSCAKPDSRLLGTWVGMNSDGDGPIWLHFAEGEKSMTEIVLVCPEPKRGIDTSFYVMHPTAAGSHSFMNVRSTIPKSLLSLKVQEDLKYPKPGGYLICKYEISSEGILKISVLTDAIAQEIQDGKLKGQVKKDRFSTEVLIRESSENLLRFIEKEDHEQFFDLFLVCRKADERLPLEGGLHNMR